MYTLVSNLVAFAELSYLLSSTILDSYDSYA
jgi:hypothetical protein